MNFKDDDFARNINLVRIKQIAKIFGRTYLISSLSDFYANFSVLESRVDSNGCGIDQVKKGALICHLVIGPRAQKRAMKQYWQSDFWI
ncbi:MAG: hypothetical protein RH981_10400 [Arenibacter sp.]